LGVTPQVDDVTINSGQKQASFPHTGDWVQVIGLPWRKQAWVTI